MAAAKSTPHTTKYKRPWWKAGKNWWPLCVFAVISVLALFFYNKGGKYRVMSGIAERVTETVAPIESARIESVHVKVGDKVQAGDIIAQLDTSIIDAESAVLKEKIIQSRLEAPLAQLTLERQFATTLENAQQALREAEMQFDLAKVEHGAVKEEVERLEPLLKQRLIDVATLAEQKAREKVLGEQLRLAPKHLASLRQDVDRATKQQVAAQQRLKSMKETIHATTEDNEEALKLLKVRREGYTLRAHQEGTVAEINRNAGDVVDTGVAIATILIDGPSRIVGFLPESNLSEIEIGTPAKVYPSVSIQQTGVIPARISQISPAVYSLPERVSPIRGQVVRGRRITFTLDENHKLVPGETVSIEIQSSFFTPSISQK